MNLQDLVPPLELCKLIPKGEFENTAFCWIDRGHACILPKGRIYPEVMPFIELRRYTIQGDEIPAPTLQEIMEALPHDNAYNDLLIGYSEKVEKLTGWHIYYNGDRKRHCYDRRAVTAALKLWMKLKGMENE